MSGMFWIALELSIPKIGFNIRLSLPVKKLDAFKVDGVAESDNTASCSVISIKTRIWRLLTFSAPFVLYSSQIQTLIAL